MDRVVGMEGLWDEMPDSVCCARIAGVVFWWLGMLWKDCVFGTCVAALKLGGGTFKFGAGTGTGTDTWPGTRTWPETFGSAGGGTRIFWPGGGCVNLTLGRAGGGTMMFGTDG